MAWYNFSLGGVTPHQKAVRVLNLAFTPLVDTAENRHTADGTTVWRQQWSKQAITLTGSGTAPLVLPGLDYSQPLALIIRNVTGVDGTNWPVWGDINLTVRARPPVVRQTPGKREYSFTLECVEQQATATHPLPFVFTLGGVTPHPLSLLGFSQSINPMVGGNVVRMGNGAAERRQHWRRLSFSLSGNGWVPLDGLDDLDYSNPVQLQLSTLQSIDAQGRPSYQTSSYSVVTDGPGHTWDMVARVYRWGLACEEA